MINSLQIKNFRCFKDVQAKGFGKINVLVGENGSGKTALLESIFLAEGGSPEIILRLRLWRGLGQVTFNITREGYESIWRDLFCRFDQKRQIEIIASGSPENDRIIKIFYKESKTLPIPLVKTGMPPADSSAIVPIVFEWTDSAGVKHPYEPEITAMGFSVGGVGIGAPATYFSSSFAAVTPTSEPANQFSDLNIHKKSASLSRAVKKVFPHISELSSESIGGTSMLYCSVPGVKVKIPVALASSGIYKLITLLLGISKQPNGIVLIDEIENGFHHSTMPKIWDAFLQFSELFNVQIFASTHSNECIKAILPTLVGNKDKFRLIRTEREEDRYAIKVFKGDEFEAAIETETEFR